MLKALKGQRISPPIPEWPITAKACLFEVAGVDVAGGYGDAASSVSAGSGLSAACNVGSAGCWRSGPTVPGCGTAMSPRSQPIAGEGAFKEAAGDRIRAIRYLAGHRNPGDINGPDQRRLTRRSGRFRAWRNTPSSTNRSAGRSSPARDEGALAVVGFGDGCAEPAIACQPHGRRS